MSAPGRFLGRWSRLKRRAESAPAAPAAPDAATPAATIPVTGAPADAAGDPAAEAGLPPVDALGPDSDFTAFLKKEVSDSLRRAALHKLFNDPHFNRMDGLDVYIDDYSIPDPIAPDMLARLRQAQTLLSDATAPAGGEAVEQLVPPMPEVPAAVAAEDAPAAQIPPTADATASEATTAAAEPAKAIAAATPLAALPSPTAGRAAAGASSKCDTLGRAGQKVPSSSK